MNRLKELRNKADLSQNKLVSSLNNYLAKNNIKGITAATFSRWENSISNPTEIMWKYLADYFNVSVPYVKGDIDKKLVSKIAKMVFLIETTPFVTDCGFTNNAYESSKMVCSLMMLLLKQLNLNCSEEFKNIILNSQKIFNDPRFENIYCSAKATGPVSYQKAKQCIEHVSYVSDRNNFENTIEDAKKLIDFYDKL